MTKLGLFFPLSFITTKFIFTTSKKTNLNSLPKHGSNFMILCKNQTYLQDTSSSRSPINSRAAECLRLSASSSARKPGSKAASTRNFSHCMGKKKTDLAYHSRGRQNIKVKKLTWAVILTNSSAKESRIDSIEAYKEQNKPVGRRAK